ncbi:hypothetical protein LCGC14_2247560, partial [marine sediment metagenome]
HGSWKHLADFQSPKTLKCQSIGWIIKENDEGVTIVSTRSEDLENVHGPMTIPQAAILERVDLGENWTNLMQGKDK